jgi:hypothetical protein
MSVQTENNAREKALWIDGPLQAKANEEWRKVYGEKHFWNITELMEHAEIINIPDELRDGTIWTFRHWTHSKSERYADFYDYRYNDFYCHMCGEQFRFALSRLVRYISPNSWELIWTCPYGHTHITRQPDYEVKSLLSDMGHFRLIEKRCQPCYLKSASQD